LFKNYFKFKGTEILTIGSELLFGDILNSNAKWIAEELSKIGLIASRQTTIGDSVPVISQEILNASKRSSLLITTGGLGPTEDDLTKEAIAQAFKTTLVQNKEVLLEISAKTKRDIKELGILNKQAAFPKDSEIIANATGTAPGIIWEPKENFVIMVFPGVPSELKNMWEVNAAPWIKKHLAFQTKSFSKRILLNDIGESIVAEDCKEIFKSKNPEVAPYAAPGQVKIRITAKANSKVEANNLILPIEKEFKKKYKNKLLSSNEKSLSESVFKSLIEKNQTISIAESCTGGLLSLSFCQFPGASSIFMGGVVAYSNQQKINLLNVSKSKIEKYGAVSKEIAEEMAIGIKEITQTDWAISVSGIAGPSGGDNNKPVGLVHFCVAGPNIINSSYRKFGDFKTRAEIQNLSVTICLDSLRKSLLSI
tara:strand:+ start:1710 stop:2978 length:1269 start_codon:yes stop_codon:yes gene_type:complete